MIMKESVFFFQRKIHIVETGVGPPSAADRGQKNIYKKIAHEPELR